VTVQTSSDKDGRTDRQIQRTTTGSTSLVSAAITRLAQVIVEWSTPVVGEPTGTHSAVPSPAQFAANTARF